MGIEYLIVNKQTKKAEHRFPISWLCDYKINVLQQPKVASSNLMEMVEFCRQESQEIEENLAGFQQIKKFAGIKQEIIENIQSCQTKKELCDTLKGSIQYLSDLDNEDEIRYYQNVLEKFQSMEDIILRYVLSDEKLYKAEISL